MSNFTVSVALTADQVTDVVQQLTKAAERNSTPAVVVPVVTPRRRGRPRKHPVPSK